MEGLRPPLIVVFQGVASKSTGQACTFLCLSLAADGQKNPITLPVVTFAGCFQQSLFKPTYKYCSYHKYMFKQP